MAKVDGNSGPLNSNTLKLEDFLSATPSYKKEYDQIDVNELVAKSLSEAGIPPESEEHRESDEGFNEDNDEDEAQPSYFDVLCRRTSGQDDSSEPGNRGDDGSTLRRDIGPILPSAYYQPSSK